MASLVYEREIGIGDIQASRPDGGESRNTASRFILQKPDISTSLMGHLDRVQTYHTFKPSPSSCNAHRKFGKHSRSIRVARDADESNSSFLSALLKWKFGKFSKCIISR